MERQKKLFAEQNTSQKNLQDAEAQLASLQIVAPVSGTVTRISAKAGAAVDANAVVAEVIDLNRLAVSAQIPASDANELKARPGSSSRLIGHHDAFVCQPGGGCGGRNGFDSRFAVRPIADCGPEQFLPVKIVTGTFEQLPRGAGRKRGDG